MKEIPLTQGKKAQVDDQDYDYLNQWTWGLLKVHHCVYAYRQIYPEGKHISILMHRLLLKVPDQMEIDHKDGDGLNNCRSNLRICTHQQNLCNRRKIITHTSPFRGVSWDSRRQKWRVRIRQGTKDKWAGYFTDEKQAALAYNWAAIIYFGEFARLNIVSP